MRRRTKLMVLGAAMVVALPALLLLPTGDGPEPRPASARVVRHGVADALTWSTGASPAPVGCRGISCRKGPGVVVATPIAAPLQQARPADPPGAPPASDGRPFHRDVGPVHDTGPESSVSIRIQNFRYCAGNSATVCFAHHQAYVAHPTTGEPSTGTYNPAALIDVRAGAKVRFVYEDGPAGPSSPLACDSFVGGPVGIGLGLGPLSCPGHAVVLAAAGPGKVQQRVGFLPREGLHDSFTWTVPKDVAPGSVVPFFCDIGGGTHWRVGMTGALRVVG